MTNYQMSAGGLYVPPSAADGAYLAHKAGTRFSEFLHFVNGANTTVTLGAGTVQVDTAVTGVQTIIPGSRIRVDNTDPLHPIVTATLTVPLTTVINGVPDVVWDADNQLVTTESV